MIYLGIDPGQDGAVVALDGLDAVGWPLPTSPKVGLDARAAYTLLSGIVEGRKHKVRVLLDVTSCDNSALDCRALEGDSTSIGRPRWSPSGEHRHYPNADVVWS